MSGATTIETSAVVTLSERAAAEIKGLFERENLPSAALRVFVSGGGCSGLQYGMQIAEESEEDDIQSEQHGVRVLIDPMSKRYLEGASIDFVEDDMGGGFKIENPNAKGGCGGGCGSSCGSDDLDGSGSGCGSCGCG